MESLCDLLFEVSNEDRLSLLRVLQDQEMNVTAIARAIEVTTQEVSRHLSRLTEVGLTEKDPNGPYRLTPFGVLTLTQIQGLEFTSRHRRYFKNHTVGSLPRRFLLRMGELQVAEYLDDVMVVIHIIEKILKEADEYLLDLNVPYIASAFPHIRDAFMRGVKGSFLHGESLELPEEMVDERKESFDDEFKAKISSSGLYEERILEIPLVMYMSEKELALLSFPKRNAQFDFYGFTSTDEDALRWCRELFEHYWAKGKPSNFD
jgi:predicted transcriptional regulator